MSSVIYLLLIEVGGLGGGGSFTAWGLFLTLLLVALERLFQQATDCFRTGINAVVKAEIFNPFQKFFCERHRNREVFSWHISP